MKSIKNEMKSYVKAEEEACKLLNSKNINHAWKKDFKKDYTAHENWDLINSDGVKVEVKSTIKPESFKYKTVTFSTSKQHKNIVIKVLTNSKGEIKKFKFIKKEGKLWLDITNKILCKN